jgi:hypothetical protein
MMRCETRRHRGTEKCPRRDPTDAVKRLRLLTVSLCLSLRASVPPCFKIAHALAAVPLLTVLGCARTPEGARRQPSRQLVLELTVAGRIQPSFQYYLALDLDQDTNTGPLPVLGPPWGNGWGTGSITHFVVVRGGQAQVFRVVPNSNLLQFESLGRPFDFRAPTAAAPGRVVVTLDLDTLVPPSVEIATAELNIIATDFTPLDPQFPGPKLVDAFGQTGNRFVTIPLTQNRVFANTDLDPPVERQGDVVRAPDLTPAPAASDLDIGDWRVEIRR